MAKYILASLLFLLPLLVLPFGASPFEIPKVIVAEILIEILLFSIFLRWKNVSLNSLNKIQLGLILVLFLLSFFHLIFLKNSDTFFGSPFRLQGIFLLWHLLVFSLISNSIKLPQKTSYFAFFSLTVLAISSLILGGDINGRAFGTLGEANSLAAASLFLFPFLLFSKSKSLKIISLTLVFWIILSSGSRSGAVAFLVQLIFLTLTFLRPKYIKIATFLCLTLIALSLIFPFIQGGGWYENRAEVWQTSLIAGTFSPIFGSGFGNIQSTLHQTSLILDNNIQYQIVDSAHNLLLDFWVQGGFIGLACLILLLIGSIKGFIKRQAKLELAALLGIFIVMLFNPVSVVILVYFWWLIDQGYGRISDLW